MSDLGLFPLPLVLLPTELVPLHIFEERYKELIEQCLAEDLDFGLVYADDEGMSDIGTRAHVVQVLTRFDDGRLDIVVEGRKRFRLVELTSGRSFQTGGVAEVVDEPDRPEEATVERALGLFDRLRTLTGSEIDIPDAGSEQLSFALAARVELPPREKLELLQEVSERVRLERVCELLEAAARTLEGQRRAAERAAGNGRVQLG
jgi:Lon protease-like protein